MTTERNKGDKAVIENATVRGAFLNQVKNGKPWIRFLLFRLLSFDGRYAYC